MITVRFTVVHMQPHYCYNSFDFAIIFFEFPESRQNKGEHWN